MNRFAFLLGAILTGLAPVPGRGDPVAISPDRPESVYAGIMQAYQQGLPNVVIPPGTYRLTAPPKSGCHLFFHELKNFEIDATGATLVFTTRDKNSIEFNRCTNVTFRGALILRDPVPFSQGKIIALGADRKTVDVQIAQGYPSDVEDIRYFPKIFLDTYDAAKRRWLDDSFSEIPIEKLGPDSFRFHSGRQVGTDTGWVVGGAVAWRGFGGSDVGLDGCQGMKIIDVTVESGAGFCVHESGGGGGNYYSYTVTWGPKPAGATEEPLLASNADAFHSSSVRRGPTLENCHFEGMNDDGVPIHGQYAVVQKSEGRDLIVETRNPPFCQPGDHLRLMDASGALAEEAQVVSATILHGFQPDAPPPKDLRTFQGIAHPIFERITLDRPTHAQFSWLTANADENGDGFVVRGCTVRTSRARGMLIKACDGLIENCTVEGNSMGGIIISPEMSYWNESDYARNLIVRHNTLRDVDYWKQPGSSQAGALSIVAFEHKHFVPLPGGHRHIIVEDNTFEDDNGTNILVSSAEDVVIRNNHFLRPMEEKNGRGSALGIDPTALIWLTECSGVQISGNVVTDPGPFLKKWIEPTSTASGTGFSDGVSLAKGAP